MSGSKAGISKSHPRPFILVVVSFVTLYAHREYIMCDQKFQKKKMLDKPFMNVNKVIILIIPATDSGSCRCGI